MVDGRAKCGRAPLLDTVSTVAAAAVADADRCGWCWGHPGGRPRLTGESDEVRAVVNSLLRTRSRKATAAELCLTDATVANRLRVAVAAAAPTPWSYDPDTGVVSDAEGAPVADVPGAANALVVLLGDLRRG